MGVYLGNAAFNPTSPYLVARKDFGRERERCGLFVSTSAAAAGVVGVGSSSSSSSVRSRSRSSNSINSTSANVEDAVRQLVDPRMLWRSHSIRVNNSLLSAAGMLILTVHCWLMLADSWRDTGLITDFCCFTSDDANNPMEAGSNDAPLSVSALRLSSSSTRWISTSGGCGGGGWSSDKELAPSSPGRPWGPLHISPPPPADTSGRHSSSSSSFFFSFCPPATTMVSAFFFDTLSGVGVLWGGIRTDFVAGTVRCLLTIRPPLRWEFTWAERWITVVTLDRAEPPSGRERVLRQSGRLPIADVVATGNLDGRTEVGAVTRRPFTWAAAANLAETILPGGRSRLGFTKLLVLLLWLLLVPLELRFRPIRLRSNEDVSMVQPEESGDPLLAATGCRVALRRGILLLDTFVVVVVLLAPGTAMGLVGPCRWAAFVTDGRRWSSGRFLHRCSGSSEFSDVFFFSSRL